MVQLWVFMDTKFGDKDELVSGRLAYRAVKMFSLLGTSFSGPNTY